MVCPVAAGLAYPKGHYGAVPASECIFNLVKILWAQIQLVRGDPSYAAAGRSDGQQVAREPRDLGQSQSLEGEVMGGGKCGGNPNMLCGEIRRSWKWKPRWARFEMLKAGLLGLMGEKFALVLGLVLLEVKLMLLEGNSDWHVFPASNEMLLLRILLKWVHSFNILH